MEISNIFVFILMLLFKFVGVSSPCPAECSKPCGLNKQGEIIRLQCTNVRIQILPYTVEDLQAKDRTEETILPFGRFDTHVLRGKSQLQKFEINNYHITSLSGECFKACPGLLTLDLSNNEIMKIEEVNFAGLGNLTSLKLNQNNLTSIGNFTFSNLPALKMLSIVQNKLMSILKNDFTGLVKITHIELHYNKIQHIDTEAFHSLQTLENLNLQHNNLTGIAAGVFSNLTSLRELNLQSNHIIILDPTSMLGTRLTKLDLWQNQISDVPTEFLSSIGHLGLTVNLAKNNITNIGSLAFNSVVLGTLYLVSNQITQVHPDALNNSFIQMLDLQQNLLQRIPQSLLCHINQSQRVLLANNPWRCECGIQWMKSLVNNSGPEPTCAEPMSYFGTKLLDAIQDKELECNPQEGTLPVPTIYPQVPPRHNYLTPKLDKEPALSTKPTETVSITTITALSTKPTETVSITTITTTTIKETLSTTNVANTKWIIAGAVAALLVIGGGVVVLVLVIKLLKPKIVPEPEMLIQRGEISFKPCLKYTPQENGWTAIM